MAHGEALMVTSGTAFSINGNSRLEAVAKKKKQPSQALLLESVLMTFVPLFPHKEPPCGVHYEKTEQKRQNKTPKEIMFCQLRQ